MVAAKAGHHYALRTGSANIDSLMEEQSLERLRDEIPKTTRDTIGICTQIGILFLWVDALCIIQDGSDSKHCDIQAMSGIYANAHVTIIAANGCDANHGLRGIPGVTDARQLPALGVFRFC